eukprot:SAG22_NODE_1036_length_5904_cov_4.908355_5_plen_226_part_00
MKTSVLPVLLILGGGVCAAAGAPAITAISGATMIQLKQLGVSCLSGDGAGGSTSSGVGAFCSPLSEFDCHVNSEADGILASKSLAGGGAAAATVPDQSDLSAPAAAAAVRSSAGDTNSTGDGPGARAVPPSEHDGYHMIQADFVDTTNLTGGAAAAAASCGPPSSPHGDLYMYMCCGLQRGSGGEKKIGIPPFAGALGCAPAQPFPSRCGSELRAGGGGGGGSFS